MKKCLFLLVLSLYSFASASPIRDRKIDPSALARLTSALNISQEADVIVETQKRWLRSPSQERWEIAELSPDQRLFVLNWATEQGLFSPWKPTRDNYDKALILGATTPLMEKRLAYLKQLWKEGTRFQEIVWLTGDRPLDQRVDQFIDFCKNESEAAHRIWEKADLPEEMRSLPVVFIEVPMKKVGSSLQRPNTADTLLAWLEKAPGPCTALFLSDQPFCGYQFAVIKAILPSEILFDLAGPGVDSTSHPAAAAITLDCIARWIYQEHLIAQSKCTM